jgi:type IV pilus assembly protein PilN
MIRINLLKPEKKEVRDAPAAPSVEVKEKKQPPLFILIVLAAIIAAAALYFHQKGQITKEQGLLNTALEEKKELQYVNIKLQELDQQKALLLRKINLITGLKAQQRNAVVIMDELSRHLPEWVWLTETGFSENSVRIKGKCMSNNLLADYIFNLKSSPLFPDVRLNSSTLRRAGTNQFLEFSLTATFSSTPPAPAESENDSKEGQK